MQNNKLGIRKRLIFILAGIAGQFAWCIENMYLNSYIAYLNFNAPAGQGFDYSLMIAITTALSAITATITTLLMGTLTDKLNKRKIFISVGYIVWGIATASFGLVNVNNANSLCLQPVENLKQMLCFLKRQHRRRLVQNQDFGVAGEIFADFDNLLIRNAQIGAHSIRIDIVKAERNQQLFGFRP